MSIEQEIRNEIDNIRQLKIDVGDINNHLSTLEGLCRKRNQKVVDDAYQKGYTDGRNVSEIQAQNNMFNEGVEYGKTQEQDRIWEYVKKIVLNSNDGGISISELNKIFGCYTIQYVFKNYTLQQIIEKLDAYDNKTWVNINNALYQCPYCKAIQHKSCRCKCCNKEVAE